MASKILWIFHGPRLLRTFKTQTNEGHDYIPGYLESIPDRFIQTIHAAIGFTYWTSPVIGIIMYRRGHFSQEGGLNAFKLALSLAAVYAAAYIIRGLGRVTNADYRSFVTALVDAKSNSCTPQAKKNLLHYDFEFWAAPVDFKWNEGMTKEKKPSKPVASTRRSPAVERSSLPCRILSYLAIHSFGRRMVYPGATSIMNYLLGSMLKNGRASLVEEHGGRRAKLETEDGNHIDTMFVDRRGKFQNGSTLVITSEGNAGFYELGCSGTPMDLGFSILGWNHPGFGGSTGVPFPDQEQRAMDAVIQYAIHELGFNPKDIALFAWSIGGYPASWAAKNYPDIQFVVLDATFDDIVPLAIAKMPQSWKNLVALSLRSYMNLNIAEQLVEYQGPVLLIRRTRDEIITTEAPPDRPPVIASNRGNHLLLKLLQYRYPTIIDPITLPIIKDFLSKESYSQAAVLTEKGVDLHECSNFFVPHAQASGGHFPLAIDLHENMDLKLKLALFLVTVHMENFESTHCTPLPGQFFHRPWQPGSRL
ncbi:hypothetical protein BsWGS_23283 [Bradybaena similaris]